MAYAPLPAKVAGDTITLANWDNIRDDFAAGVPDIYTAKGDLAAATAADTATRLAIGADDATLVPDSGQANGLAWQIQPAARVYNSADIDPAPSGWVTLTFDSERYDTDTCHSTVANTDRLTVPSDGAGLYHIGGNIEFDTSGYAAGEARYGVRFLLNGATVIGVNDQIRAHGSIDHVVPLAIDYALAVADYLQLQVYTANDIDILADANFSPEFWFHWFRRQ